jgi:hypothetical protein
MVVEREPLVVDPGVHARELRRFEPRIVRGPGGDDCAIWVGAIGAAGYGRNRPTVWGGWCAGCYAFGGGAGRPRIAGLGADAA